MGIHHSRILEWVATPFSRGSSQPRDQTQVSHNARGFFTDWATGEALWDDYMVFISQLVNMVYHIDWFAYIEKSFHPWDKPRLVMVYDFFLLKFYVFTLQYCIGFAIHWHDPPQVYMSSQPWTSLPPPSPYHLSGSSQCTSPKHPVSCIEPGLVIHFSSKNMQRLKGGMGKSIPCE